MYDSRILGAALVCTAALALTGAGESGCHDKKATADKSGVNLSFEKLKGLAGDWEIASPKSGVQKGKVMARYHLTSGDSAVVETVFPGEGMEMVTVYHRDGDQIMLTHYCHVGNQPRMRTKGIADSGELVFDFVDGTNFDPATDTHMHDARIRFVDADHIHSEWQLYKDGKAAEKVEIDLVRKK
jgi:hypothetical protein